MEQNTETITSDNGELKPSTQCIDVLRASRAGLFYVIGGPGSGKTLVADKIAELAEAEKNSIGAIIILIKMSAKLGERRVKNDAIGRALTEFEPRRIAGELVPDHLVIPVFLDALYHECLILANKKRNGERRVIMIEGFPRNLVQLRFSHLLEMPRTAVCLNISKEVYFERAHKRFLETGRQDDANPKTLTDRWDLWEKQTQPAAIALGKRINGSIPEISGTLALPKRTRLIIKRMELGKQDCVHMCNCLNNPNHIVTASLLNMDKPKKATPKMIHAIGTLTWTGLHKGIVIKGPPSGFAAFLKGDSVAMTASSRSTR